MSPAATATATSPSASSSPKRRSRCTSSTSWASSEPATARRRWPSPSGAASSSSRRNTRLPLWWYGRVASPGYAKRPPLGDVHRPVDAYLAGRSHWTRQEVDMDRANAARISLDSPRDPQRGDTATRSEALLHLLGRQRGAFQRDGAPSLAQRRRNLTRLREAVIARRRDLEAALEADFGHRSRHETGIMEMLPFTWGVDYLLKNLRRFMRPERRRVALPMQLARARVEYQPLGVIGIVAPWNYPFSLAVTPLATALAAGNRAMIKPSEQTPATG